MKCLVGKDLFSGGQLYLSNAVMAQKLYAFAPLSRWLVTMLDTVNDGCI